MKKENHSQNKILNFFFQNERSAPLWLLVRLYVGYKWLHSGVGKLFSPTWVGHDAPQSLLHFLNNTLAKANGPNPSIMSWYAWLTQHIFIPFASELSYLVVAGEILVGLSILFGLWLKKGAIAGAFLNLNYLLAGSISINPILLILEILLILSSKISGSLGIDGLLRKNKKSP